VATSSQSSHVQEAKSVNPKARRKRSGTATSKGPGGLLGGADYVALMMGGRRKAREEAKKLPKDNRES
jgi:hypothetical protein